MWADHQMRAELDYCVERGIPHSVFLGRVVGPNDPQWTDDDRDKVLAYRDAMASVCPSCRTRRELWERDDLAYIGQLDSCPGCRALSEEEQNIPPAKAPWVKAYMAPRHLVGDPIADLGAV